MGIMGSAPWSEAESQLACALWLSGQTASQIAARLGTGRTRNAILGRLNRKLGTGAKGGAPRSAPRKGVPAPGKIIIAALAARAKTPSKIKTPLVTSEPPSRPEGYVGKPFAALKAGECRHIENEPRTGLYCAAPVGPESSYCPAHHRLCYQPGTAWRGGKRGWGE